MLSLAKSLLGSIVAQHVSCDKRNVLGTWNWWRKILLIVKNEVELEELIEST